MEWVIGGVAGLIGGVSLLTLAAALAGRRSSSVQTIGGDTPPTFPGTLPPDPQQGAAESWGGEGGGAPGLSSSDTIADPVVDLAAPDVVPLSQDTADSRDVEALARMLAGEDHHPDIEVVIGWYAIQHAARRHISVWRLLTGRSGQYGPRVLNGEGRYASTAGKPTVVQRQLASELLAGRVYPSLQVRQHGVGAWVELGGEKHGSGALALLRLQIRQSGPQKGSPNFGGIWGRLADSRWYLYNERDPAIGLDAATDDQAAAVLAKVPEVPAIDPGSGPAVA